MKTLEVGDICEYCFEKESRNKSHCVVQILKILDDPRGVANVRFLKVNVDDSGNGYFTWLRETGNTMNVSTKYLTKADKY